MCEYASQHSQLAQGSYCACSFQVSDYLRRYVVHCYFIEAFNLGHAPNYRQLIWIPWATITFTKFHDVHFTYFILCSVMQTTARELQRT